MLVNGWVVLEVFVRAVCVVGLCLMKLVSEMTMNVGDALLALRFTRAFQQVPAAACCLSRSLASAAIRLPRPALVETSLVDMANGLRRAANGWLRPLPFRSGRAVCADIPSSTIFRFHFTTKAS